MKLKIDTAKVNSWVPVVKFKPISSYKSRLMFKIKWIFVRIRRQIKFKTHLSGCNSLGIDIFGNRELQLRRSGLLGNKGSLVYVPNDKVIRRRVEQTAAYEFDTVTFLATALSEANDRKAFIDIGANTGLITLQTMNSYFRFNTAPIAAAYLFEPISQFAQAITVNLKNLNGFVEDIQIIEKFLDSETNSKEVFINPNNLGNISAFRLLESKQFSKQTINTIDAKVFFTKVIKDFDSFILKCDIEGYDAKVLSRLPKEFFEKLNAAVIEIHPHPAVNQSDIVNTINRLGVFGSFGFRPDMKYPITNKALELYWLDTTKSVRNIYYKKTN